jgi:hypothetical protein
MARHPECNFPLVFPVLSAILLKLVEHDILGYRGIGLSPNSGAVSE